MIVGAYSRIFDEMDEAFTALTRERGTHEPVYLNAHQAPHTIPRGATVYNMENVGVQIPPTMFDGCAIWDMSERNVALWRNHGRNAVHVPLGYHPVFERFTPKPWKERDIDVLLLGWSNVRRQNVLNELARRGLKALRVYDIYGVARDQLLARTRVVLNMLFYTTGFFPQLRLLKSVPNHVLTVSEEAIEAPSWATPAPVPYHRLADKCAELCALSDNDANALAEQAKSILHQNPLRLPA